MSAAAGSAPVAGDPARPGFAPIRRKAFGAQITEHLRDAIVRGELPRGRRLLEGQLAEEFDVSRGPVRDAFRQLERESLVESRGASGTFVIGISEVDIDELYSLRGAIELLAAELAVERSTAGDWAELALLTDELERTADEHDRESFAAADIEFHSRIYGLSGHRRLSEIWHQYAPMLTTLLRTTVLVQADLHESAAKHRLLLDLMAAGDQPSVASELREHLRSSHQRMLEMSRDRRLSQPPDAG